MCQQRAFLTRILYNFLYDGLFSFSFLLLTYRLPCNMVWKCDVWFIAPHTAVFSRQPDVCTLLCTSHDSSYGAQRMLFVLASFIFAWTEIMILGNCSIGSGFKAAESGLSVIHGLIICQLCCLSHKSQLSSLLSLFTNDYLTKTKLH